MRTTYLNWITALSGFGVALSVYSFAHKTGFASGAICNLSDTFNCDIVNQGPYSDVFGIPVAAIGVIGYFFLCIASLMKRVYPSDRGFSLFLLIASAAGVLFSFYLSGLEAFVLRAWCIVCLFSQATITAIAILAFLHHRQEQAI